jgi:hypothetical protein
MKGIIYKIEINGKIYIGSTKQKYLSHRQAEHNFDYRKKRYNMKLYLYAAMCGIEKLKCEWICDIEFEHLNQLRTIENKYIKEYNACLNERKAIRTEKEVGPTYIKDVIFDMKKIETFIERN